ncbi:MAG: hypothetical protein DMG07_21180, partial [Acidobacteria bacterium]
MVAGARLIALALLWDPAIAQTAARNAYPSRATYVPARPTTTVLDVDESGLYVQLPDGRLMGFTDRVKVGVPEAIARYSTNEGRSWSEPQTLVEFPKGTSGWTMNNVLLDRHGEIHLVYYKGGNNSGKSLYDQRLDIWHVRSVDGRTRFKPPKLVWEGYAGALLSVVQLRSGRILLPFSYLTPRRWRNRGTGFDAFTYMGRFSSSALYSDDDGDTWRQSPDELKEATATIDADGGIEPIVIQLKNGVVWMLIRTQDNYFFESFSKDDGAHWSRPRPTRIMSSDSPPSLTRLKDGRILMLWNNCLRYPYANGGRHVMHGAVSEDEGRAWRGFREVARSPMVAEPPPPDGDHGVSSYGVPGLTKEGNIVAALPWPGGPGGKSYLLHVDPSWLYEVRQADDFSKGLEQWSIFGTKGVEVVVS